MIGPNCLASHTILLFESVFSATGEVCHFAVPTHSDSLASADLAFHAIRRSGHRIKDQDTFPVMPAEGHGGGPSPTPNQQ